MSHYSPLIEELIEALRVLQGVGRKSAQRMAFNLLQHKREGALALSAALEKAVSHIGQCQHCRCLTEQPVCHLCASEKRDRSTLCVVESPADVIAFEQAGGYNGQYFVLMGHLSPIDGIGPEDIGIDRLIERAQALQIGELILATNPTVEGEATAYYIAEQLREMGVKVSRIAHGVPLGGELEYVDSGTLAHALSGRRAVQ
ncbi:recombination mediator RecR [Litorivivens sp.]|uniref:recombination mediator RecR n=1 Tax=Litorivivens sp. TaxID=2020868 RepID=UPI003561ADC8